MCVCVFFFFFTHFLLTFSHLWQFGEVDVDSSLVVSQQTGVEDIIMLNNGCLCCTVRGDLVRMLSELVTTKKGKFDHIIIETTGSCFSRFLINFSTFHFVLSPCSPVSLPQGWPTQLQLFKHFSWRKPLLIM